MKYQSAGESAERSKISNLKLKSDKMSLNHEIHNNIPMGTRSKFSPKKQKFYSKVINNLKNEAPEKTSYIPGKSMLTTF